jgi:hypothetical protein
VHSQPKAPSRGCWQFAPKICTYPINNSIFWSASDPFLIQRIQESGPYEPDIISVSLISDHQVSASSLLQVPSYQPRAKAASITCPLLIVLPTEDNLCLPGGAVQISQATEKCELVSVPCAWSYFRVLHYLNWSFVPGGHFDLYHGRSHHTESITAQLEFLKKHVPVPQV